MISYFLKTASKFIVTIPNTQGDVLRKSNMQDISKSSLFMPVVGAGTVDVH